MSEAALTVSVSEAARLLGIGRNAAYELIRQGALPHVRFGRTIRVPRSAIEPWLLEVASARRVP